MFSLSCSSQPRPGSLRWCFAACLAFISISAASGADKPPAASGPGLKPGTPLPVQTAAPEHAAFHADNAFAVKVPAGAGNVRIWLAVPQQSDTVAVSGLVVDAPYPVRYGSDSWGNRVAYVEAAHPAAGEIDITEHFDLKTTETLHALDAAKTRPLSDAERNALQRYLLPTTNVIVNPQIRALAAQITGDEANPILAARKLYDWTLENVSYWVEDPDHMKASGIGSTAFCLATRSGNCTDFHSLFSSLAIAAGLPTRMVYGSLLKPTLDGVPVDASYHCWIEFYAPNYGWIPLDVALANIYGREFPLSEKNRTLVERTTATGYHGFDRSRIDYYFGNLDDRRFAWSTGRDLMMQPPQDDGPVNSLQTAYVEVDGKVYTDWTRKLTYQEQGPKPASQ